MDFALKALFKTFMYQQTNVERVADLKDMYEVCFTAQFFENLEGLIRDGVSLDRILTSANEAYQEVCANA